MSDRASIDSLLSQDAAYIRLCRIDRKGDLILYEGVTFPEGPRRGCELYLRRAQAVGGAVVLDPPGDHGDYFCDILDADWSIVQDCSLDHGSWKYLKEKLRPKVLTYERS
jgi:hypothetical protein